MLHSALTPATAHQNGKWKMRRAEKRRARKAAAAAAEAAKSGKVDPFEAHQARERKYLTDIEQNARETARQRSRPLFPSGASDKEGYEWWQAPPGLVFGEAGVSEGERQRHFGGLWKNSHFQMGTQKSSIIHALANLFYPPTKPPAPSAAAKLWMRRRGLKPQPPAAPTKEAAESEKEGSPTKNRRSRRVESNESTGPEESTSEGSPIKNRRSSRSRRVESSESTASEAAPAATDAPDEAVAKEEAAPSFLRVLSEKFPGISITPFFPAVSERRQKTAFHDGF